MRLSVPFQKFCEKNLIENGGNVSFAESRRFENTVLDDFSALAAGILTPAVFCPLVTHLTAMIFAILAITTEIRDYKCRPHRSIGVTVPAAVLYHIIAQLLVLILYSISIAPALRYVYRPPAGTSIGLACFMVFLHGVEGFTLGLAIAFACSFVTEKPTRVGQLKKAYGILIAFCFLEIGILLEGTYEGLKQNRLVAFIHILA